MVSPLLVEAVFLVARFSAISSPLFVLLRYVLQSIGVISNVVGVKPHHSKKVLCLTADLARRHQISSAAFQSESCG